MKNLIITIFIVLASTLWAEDTLDIQKKIKLLDSDDAKIREQTKAEILKHAFLYTRELKANLNNSSLEVQDSCKEILKKYYSYTSESMQNHFLPLATKENSKETESLKYANWIKKTYLSSYQKNGKKDQKWNANVEKLLLDVCEYYSFHKDVRKEVAESAKKILDLGCDDLYVTYTYANMCYGLNNFDEAQKYFLICEKIINKEPHPAIFKYLVMNKLAGMSDKTELKISYTNSAIIFIAEAFNTTPTEDLDALSTLIFDFFKYTLKNSEREVLTKLNIPESKNEIGKIILNSIKLFSGKVSDDKIEYIENLFNSIPKNNVPPKILPKLMTFLAEYCHEIEYTRKTGYKALEISPESSDVALKILDSLTDDRDRHYDQIIFGAEYYATIKNAAGAEIFLTAFWQLICSESHYQYFGWHEFIDDPSLKDLLVDAFSELQKTPNLSPYQKSMIGVYAYLKKDFKLAINELNNYQNSEFKHRQHAYISKEKILSEVLPLKYLNSNEMIEFCTKVTTEPFAVTRAQLFINLYRSFKTEKQKFYISQLLHYTRFTNKGETNEALCQILFELGYEELIIKNYIDYNNEFNLPPEKVIEFIKLKLDPLTVSLFEISKPWKFTSTDDFNNAKTKIEEKIAENLKNIDNKKEFKKIQILNAKNSIAQSRILYYLIYKNTMITEDEISSLSIKNSSTYKMQEFFETYDPFMGVNKKIFPYFQPYSSGSLGEEGGYFIEKETSDKKWIKEFISTKKIPEQFKNEDEAFAFVREAYKERLGSIYKLNLTDILLKQGYNELADYICIKTFSIYNDLLIYDKSFNYYDLKKLFDVKNVQKSTLNLLFLTLYSYILPHGFNMLEATQFMLLNKEFEMPMYFENAAEDKINYPNKFGADPKYIVEGQQVTWQQLLSHETNLINQEQSLSQMQKDNLLRLISKMKNSMEKR